MKKVLLSLFVATTLLLALPYALGAQDQGDFGTRVRSRDGKWLLPLASRLNGSDEEKHTGRGSVSAWDIVAPLNSPVYAMGPGKVEYAGCNNKGGYGCWAFINHGEFKAIYGHMVNGSITIKSGDRVDASIVIGRNGFTGMTSFGPHVHLEMHKPGGGRFRIDQWFDRNQMRFCNLCSAKGEPAIAQGATVNAPVASTAPVVTRSADKETQMMLAILVFALLLAFVAWLFRDGQRYSPITDAAVAVIVMLTPVWLPMWVIFANGQPLTTTASAAPAMSAAGDSASWKAAYAFMRKWEGARCVHDPVRTLKGITNGTYNAWRRDKGMGPGDVCTDLTEQQAEAIYYERYWVASGAPSLPPLTAITHFDHAVNAGVGAAKNVLAQCVANDVNCYNRARIADYKSKGNCYLYCRAWFNRVADIVRYQQSLVQ